MSTDTPGAWDLDWEPLARSGGPVRWPPARAASYAEFPIRAAAFAIDVVIVTMIMQLVSQAVGLTLFFFTRDSATGSETAVGIAAAAVFVAAVGLTASAVYFWRVFRATPGQMLFGLFVVQLATGRLPSLRAAVGRWLLLYAPLALVMSYSSIWQVLSSTGLFSGVDPLLVTAAVLLLPLAWYLVLALSTLAEGRRGRGLHDRLAGTVVVRRAGPPA